jgi:hypothetical protein
MAEGLPTESAPNPADYETALRHFFDVTAAELQMGNTWIDWAQRFQMVEPDIIAGYRDNLMQQANINTDCARNVISGWRGAGITVWLNHPEHGPALIEGVQYSLGEPWYRAGIKLGGRMQLVPLDAEHPLEVRAPASAASRVVPFAARPGTAVTAGRIGSLPHVAKLSTL